MGVEEIRYRVWFEGEPAARSRYFTDRAEACAWASANQPNRPYEVQEERQGVGRRLFNRLRND